MKKNKINKKTVLLFIILLGMLIYACIPTKFINYNSKTKLDIVTAYGDNQAYHPKVVDFEKEWNGYKYWMAYTPYPNGNEDYENPHIVASNNLIKWETPKGLLNPIDEISNDGVKEQYDSDTHLLYNPDLNRMECFWRFVDDINNKVIIYRSYTTNGRDFSDKEVFIESDDRKNLDYVSPAIVYENGKYKMWYVDKRKVNYRETKDGINWSDIQTLNFSFKGSGKLYTWHIDVEATPKGYEMILVAYQNVNIRNTMKLYHTYSTDEVENWSKAEVILEPTTRTDNWDNSGLYRSCLVYEDGVYIVFYSGISTKNDHGIGIVYGKDIKKLKSVDIDFNENENSSELLELIKKEK